MRHEDAVTIAGIISDVLTSRRSASLFPEGKDGTPSTLGVIWIDEIMKISDQETELATQAAIDLMIKTSRPPQIEDFKEMLRKIKRDKWAATPGLPEPDFKRELPAWVRGKLLALSQADVRVWPDQRAGYDYLQKSNPHYRTYVWPEQEVMPGEDQDRYIEEAKDFTMDDFERIFTTVGSLWGQP